MADVVITLRYICPCADGEELHARCILDIDAPDEVLTVGIRAMIASARRAIAEHEKETPDGTD